MDGRFMERDRLGGRAVRAAVVAMVLSAGLLALLGPPAAALTEYRYEVVIATPSPLDYKGVAWAPDGSEALVVGGIQAVLRYEDGTALQVAGSNWSTASQTVEEVAYGPDGTAWVCGGRLNGSRMMGLVWRVTSAGIEPPFSVDGDLLTAVSVSTSGRVLAVGVLGGVYELRDGVLQSIGSSVEATLNDVAWAPDGSGAFVVGSPGTVRWFDAATDALTTVGFTGTGSLNALSWRPGTMSAWAAGEGGLVVELNATTMAASRVRPSTPRAPDLYGVSWHSLGDRALLVGAEGTTLLWRMGVFTEQTVDVSKDLLDASWSPIDDLALVTGVEGTVLRYAPRLPPQNQAPTAVISSPSDGARFEEGSSIRFDGSQSSDPDGDALTFTWSSNATGAFGWGEVVHASLPVGRHTVTLHADDGRGHNSTATVGLEVRTAAPPPQVVTVEILHPRPAVTLSGTIDVRGTASCTVGEVVRVEVRLDEGPWAAAQGTREFLLQVDTRALADGLHGVRARAVASDGATGEDNVVFDVRNLPVDPTPELPNVTIRLLGRAVVDELVRFEAVGVDGVNWTIVWAFGDGALGEGLRAFHAYGEEGTYEVALLLYRPGDAEPLAAYTYTVIVEERDVQGLSLERLAVVGAALAVGIYLIGFYAGRRLGRDGDRRHRR